MHGEKCYDHISSLQERDFFLKKKKKGEGETDTSTTPAFSCTMAISTKYGASDTSSGQHIFDSTGVSQNSNDVDDLEWETLMVIPGFHDMQDVGD